MTSSVAASPARLSRTDLGAGQAVRLGVLALAAVVGLDLLDGRLGIVYSVGFVLVVATLPLAVDVRALFPTGVLPPVLLVVSLAVVALLAGDAIVVAGMPPDVGWFGRTLAAVIDHGVTLVVGHALALVVIVLRIVTQPRA